jgi:hypothetical protein
MRDYSERRQSRVLAPPKRPKVWPYVLLILMLLLIAFGAGLGAGWYLYKPGGKFYKSPQIPQAAAAPEKHSTLPPQGEPIAPAPAQSPAAGQPAADKAGGAPPLTFYNTLQKGNKELMGTGINQPKESQPHAPSIPSPAPPER